MLGALCRAAGWPGGTAATCQEAGALSGAAVRGPGRAARQLQCGVQRCCCGTAYSHGAGTAGWSRRAAALRLGHAVRHLARCCPPAQVIQVDNDG
jgi:hypothetical protein